MHLEHLRDSLVQGGCECYRFSVDRTRVSLGFTHPFEANGIDNFIPRLVVSKLQSDEPMI
jgi:hypothetical protein